MSFCPSCGNQLDINASGCKRCQASFEGPDAWKPVDRPPETEGTRFSTTNFVLKVLGAVLIMCLGAAYGVSSYDLFARLFTRPEFGASGLMLVSFLAGIPLAIGLLVGYLARRRRVTGIAGAAGMSGMAVCLFIFAAGALLREGMVCIVMATPIFVVLALIGGIIGALINATAGTRGPKLLSVALVVPFLLAPLESEVEPSPRQLTMTRSAHISASPEVIWQHINFPLDIRPEEFQQGIAYRIGVPYPLEARTLEGRVGGRRTLQWQRGVQFGATITTWEPMQRIAWKYKFDAASFPPGSLDDHIVIGGRYFGLESTSYALTPDKDGTTLTIAVTVTVDTNFNAYAAMWARYFVDDAEQMFLAFYKARSEASVHGLAAGAKADHVSTR